MNWEIQDELDHLLTVTGGYLRSYRSQPSPLVSETIEYTATPEDYQADLQYWADYEIRNALKRPPKSFRDLLNVWVHNTQKRREAIKRAERRETERERWRIENAKQREQRKLEKEEQQAREREARHERKLEKEEQQAREREARQLEKERLKTPVQFFESRGRRYPICEDDVIRKIFDEGLLSKYDIRQAMRTGKTFTLVLNGQTLRGTFK